MSFLSESFLNLTSGTRFSEEALARQKCFHSRACLGENGIDCSDWLGFINVTSGWLLARVWFISYWVMVPRWGLRLNVIGLWLTHWRIVWMADSRGVRHSSRYFLVLASRLINIGLLLLIWLQADQLCWASFLRTILQVALLILINTESEIEGMKLWRILFLWIKSINKISVLVKCFLFSLALMLTS